MAGTSCPSCDAALEEHQVEGLYGRSFAIDICRGCQGIWFDDGESLQLSPHGTLALFRVIHEHPAGRRPLPTRLNCPRCRLRLSLLANQQRSTRFQYYRCARGHGRFITFFHFLRARNFVRSLTPREVSDLRARVKQVNCSNCGAPVDLDRDVACQYCRAPISMLDPNQVTATLAELRAADERRQQIDPTMPLTLLLERQKSERVFNEAAGSKRLDLDWTLRASAGSSLVDVGLDAMMSWLRAD